MKLQSVDYSINNEWHTIEYVPSNPRSILIYTLEGGVSEGYFQNDKWFVYKWNCTVIPQFWREMPRYESNDSL